MNCPYCAATTIKERAKKTKLGYALFFGPHCRHIFNERTGTPVNSLAFPTDIFLLAVLLGVELTRFWRGLKRKKWVREDT